MHETLITDLKFHLDSFFEREGGVELMGWCGATYESVRGIRFRKGDLIFDAAYGAERKDVLDFYAKYQFLNVGFTVFFPNKFKDSEGIYAEALISDTWTKIKDITGDEANALLETNELFKISKKTSPGFIVVDDFYENPDEVRRFALSCSFSSHNEYHKGQRTEKRFLPSGLKGIFEKLLHKRIFNFEEHGTNGIFQFCIAEDKLVYHVDSQTYAAVIYLTPDAPASSGTSFYKSKKNQLRGKPTDKDAEKQGKSKEELFSEIFDGNFYDKSNLELVDVVGNVYNRLVIWDASLIHAASDYFGKTKEDSRLFHLFFFDAY